MSPELLDTAWPVWAGATLTTFAALELWAVRANRNDLTLSGWLRRQMGIEPSRPWGWAAAVAFVAGLALLASHITLGWP